ncbi:MAG: DUF2203 domain-containing protein [Nanoarchaeota archaeon]
MQKKYFSLDEAQSILPEVKKLLGELLDLQEKIRIVNSLKIKYDDDFLEAHNLTKKTMNMHKGAFEFFSIVNNLIEKGVFVKDPAAGLVDFYSLFEDREIFLCYKYPEEKIFFWHGIDEGYSRRKSVDLLKEKI